MIPHKEQKTPGDEPTGGREMAYTWQATASSLDLNQYAYLYTVRNMPKDLLFQPAMSLWSKGIAQECSSCVIPTWKGTMVPPFQVSVHQHIFLGEVLQSSWLVMNQLPTCSRTHPSQACQSVCAALLPCAGLVGSSHGGDALLHLSTLHSSTLLWLVQFPKPCRDIPGNNDQELVHQVLFSSYCLPVTPR